MRSSEFTPKTITEAEFAEAFQALKDAHMYAVKQVEEE